jgi:MoxR-like ATPase
MLPLVVKSLRAHCHVWLVGPAGSGKSSIAANAAAELNLPYASLSVCGQTTKTDFLGYMDAHGVYRTTCFRQAYERGGVFCLDEVDNGNANVLAVINSALSNSVCTFPDKTVECHPNFLVVACANTFGLGSHSGYVGRTHIDTATLDRFFFIEIPYDEGLEMHIAGDDSVASPEWDAAGKEVPTPTEWIKTVKKVRARVIELNLKAVVSPRATLMGTSLIKEEVPLQFLQKGLLFKSLTSDVISKIQQ